MALATHHLQVSYRTSPLRFSSSSTQNTLRDFVTKFQPLGQKDQFISLKCRSILRKGVPLVPKPKGKSLKISAYKSNNQKQSGARVGESNSLQNFGKLPYVPRESEDTSVESKSTQNTPISYHAEADETTNYSSIQSKLRSWLTFCHTPSSNGIMNGALEETSVSETFESRNLIQKKENGEVLKAVWRHFQSLDATITIALLTFVPLYLAVTLVYGAKVSGELTPLWILGACLVALYIKMLGSISAIYVFFFKNAANAIKTFLTYYTLAYNYIARGKIKDDIRAHSLQLMVDFKNSDYTKLAKRKVRDLELFLVEMYLDFLELLWPCYSKTVRFIKKTKFI